jgi:hypothetical protein
VPLCLSAFVVRALSHTHKAQTSEDIVKMKPTSFLEQFISWAASQPDIKGIALVGSYARGTAGPGSDLDLIVLTSNPNRYLQDHTWLLRFGAVVSTQNETWGRVETVRSTYEPGLEVEYNFAPLEWADVPVDAGTRRVVKEGFTVLFDPDGMLEALQAAVL